jgi:hypothetical protein
MRPVIRMLGAIVLGTSIGVLPNVSAMAASPAKPYEFVVDNDVWQPGRRARNGSDWLALHCLGTACRFAPARLQVKAESWQGHYDDRPTRGQRLSFRLVTPAPGRTIAWFRVTPKHPPLSAGPVTTYASAATPFKRPASEGTLEIAVDLPDSTQATLVPMLDREAGAFRLQLRAGGRRQLLGELGQCSREVSRNYLLWAGELDGDGKPDYLVSFADADGQAILLLSGAARGPEEPLVGVGGTYSYPPYGGECDSQGWLGQ